MARSNNLEKDFKELTKNIDWNRIALTVIPLLQPLLIFGLWLGASKLDKWAFFRASKYANEEISYTFDGATTNEARFSCNATISSTDSIHIGISYLSIT